MVERDRFELDLAIALREYLEDAPTEVWPTELAGQVAMAYPHRRAAFGRWSFGPVPALAWLLLLAGLLVALVGGALIAGSPLRRFLPAVVPPVGQSYDCPAGSTPDEPGPVDQARPPYHAYAKLVFDRDAGRLVAVTGGSADGNTAATWTFDVCTNTWTEMHPDRELPDWAELVYDVDSGATIGIVDGTVWAYDLGANTWTEKGVAPSEARLVAYDPVSGLVVAASGFDLVGLWTYDVGTDTWTHVRQVNAEPCGYVQFGYDVSVDLMVTYRGAGWGSEKAMCLIDTRSSSWSETRVVTPPDFSTGFYTLSPAIVYDEATERMVFSDGRRLAAYSATTDRWEILAEADSGVGVPLWMAYDPRHRRLVGVSWDAEPVVAFDPVTHDWMVLLDRDPSAGPWPVPTPAPTPLEPDEGQPVSSQAATPAPTSAPTPARTASPTAAP